MCRCVEYLVSVCIVFDFFLPRMLCERCVCLCVLVCKYSVCLYGILFVCVSGVHTYIPYINTHIYVMRIMINISGMSFI